MEKTYEKPKIFKGRGRIVTDILGRRKYTNYSQALNEAVANSLDAKAKEIKIIVNKEFIEIIDDGIGMSEEVLRNRYFTLGVGNPDPQARGLFGIGVCANSALGDLLIVETRPSGASEGIRAVVDFTKVEKTNIGEYEPENWERINFAEKRFNTKIRIEKLRWQNINIKEIEDYLIKKHWPILIDPEYNVKILVNGKNLKAEEPQNAQKFPFDSLEYFRIGDKYVPPQLDLDCGRVRGVFYLIENCKDPSIDVYVHGQRIDAYSGDKVDWLGIKYLRSPEGFRSRLKGIIKVQAEDKEKVFSGGPPGKYLILKSGRDAFFEDTFSFKALCAYLNEKSQGKILNLPYGGILRIINDEWYKARGRDIKKTQAYIEKLKPELFSDLREIFKGEKFVPKIGKGEEIKKIRKEKTREGTPKPKNVMFKCPQCGNIIRVKIIIVKKWEKATELKKRKMREKYWVCPVCRYILDPLRDKYRRGKITGTRIVKVELEEGIITDIIADALGKEGPRAVYVPEENILKINAEHSLLVYSLKTSDEAFKCNLLDSIIYAVSLRRSQDRGTDFQEIYNKLCSNIQRVIDISEYEKALETFELKKLK
jgi:hypothetical protein